VHELVEDGLRQKRSSSEDVVAHNVSATVPVKRAGTATPRNRGTYCVLGPRDRNGGQRPQTAQGFFPASEAALPKHKAEQVGTPDATAVGFPGGKGRRLIE